MTFEHGCFYGFDRRIAVALFAAALISLLAVSVASGEEPMTVRAYVVTDVLQRARDVNNNLDGAKDRLVRQLQRACGIETSPHEEATSEKSSLPGQPSFAWCGHQLVVKQTPEMHGRIAARIEKVRGYGFGEIRVEVRFVALPPEMISQLCSLGTVEYPLVDKWNQPDPGQGMPVLPIVGTSSCENIFSQDEGTSVSRARTVVEKELPLMHALINDAQAKKLIEQVTESKQGSIVAAPKITLCDGDSASIADESQRPFVVGIDANGSPQVRLVSEGTRVHLRCAISDDDTIQLDCLMTFACIREVEEIVLPGATRPSPVTLQVPEVATTTVQTRVAVPNGNTVVLSGLTAENMAGDYEPIAVMLRPVHRNLPDPQSEPVAVQSVPDLKQVPATNEIPAVPGNMYANLYNVADLAIPIADFRTIGGARQPASQTVQPNLDSLVDLISRNIASDTWEAAGGAGVIKKVESNLALVVRHTPEVHQKIQSLLEQLRRLNDMQVSLELQFVRVPKTSDVELAFEPQTSSVIAKQQVNDLVRKSLLKEGAVRADESVIQGPRVNLFNGQRARLPLGFSNSQEQAGAVLHICPVISDNLQSIYLATAIDAPKTASQPQLSTSHRVPEGASLVLDITDDLIIEKTPAPRPSLAKRFTDVIRAGFTRPEETESRYLLLVSPSLSIPEEDEDRLE